MPDTPLIEGRGLTKRFGDFTAVDGIDFRVEPGEVFGFLGPNGAGKTSTMRMIGCVSPVSGGELRVSHLERDVAVVLLVAREIHRGHAPGANLALDDIAVAEGATELFSQLWHRANVTPWWR